MEQLRMLGIYMGLPGTKIMKEFLNKTRRPENLTPKQRVQVLEAWDTRHVVPHDKLEYVDKVIPEEELYGEEYEIRYVELIYYYLQTI